MTAAEILRAAVVVVTAVKTVMDARIVEAVAIKVTANAVNVVMTKKRETAVVAPARMTAAEILRAAAVVVNAVKTVMDARTVEAVVTKVPVAIKVTANAVNVVMTKKRETAVVAPARMTAAEIL